MVTAKDSLIKSRIAAGLTMRDLSERSGVPIATISRAENGKPLSTKSAHRLCKAFDLGFNDLFIFQGNTATSRKED